MKPYKPYRLAHIVNNYNWRELVTFKREDVELLEKEWAETEKYNNEIKVENSNLLSEFKKELDSLLDKYGVKFRYNKSIFSKSSKKYESWYLTFYKKVEPFIYKSYPYHFPYAQTGEATINDLRVYYGKSPVKLVELYDTLCSQLKKKGQEKETVEKHFVKCVQLAVENKIDIDGLLPPEVKDKVEDFLKDKWMKDNYPDGTEVEIDDNHCECSSHTIGERRCSCGNRRIAHYVEGNCLSGYYLVTEPC